MMNKYNTSNPFIQMLSERYLKLKSKCSHQSKNILKQNFWITFLTAFTVLITKDLNLLWIILFYMVTSYGLFKMALQNIPFNKIEEVYSGDEFKIQSINDEKIINLLTIMWKGEGILKFLSNILVILFCITTIWLFLNIAITFYQFISAVIFV